ncbi:hypothetical protein RD055328_13860 [Companilactobacillus sp. RD055328]|uniref:DUF951 domain-containing protein n=1 Tax=Companilactobacillus sp. RD055328 TaxID=2916634 RepID=UPI001FC7FFCE|nr:DUF951 family protein [Companilactobacillus sp. RD055328]GKQ43463.1 hypothetical protein RD055328_13860 [Companilactobacillus sp. RD055328]
MYDLGDIVVMKKPHACGENRWEIIRVGADFKIKCLNCAHIVMISRKDFEKKVKSIKTKAIDVTTDIDNYVKFEN